MNKFAVLLISLFIFSTIISGCQNKSAGTKAVIMDLPVNTEPVTLVIWGAVDDAYLYQFNQLSKAFSQEYPNITLKFMNYGRDSLKTNLDSLNNTKSSPDLVYAPGDVIGYFAEKKMIQSVSNIVPSLFIDSCNPVSKELLTVNNQLFALPEVYGNNIALIYNKKLVKDVPEDFKSIKELAISYEESENQIEALMFDRANSSIFIGIYYGYGGKLLDSYNRPTLNNKAMIDSLSLLQNLPDYHIDSDHVTQEKVDQAFVANNTAMVLNGAWAWQDYHLSGVDIGVAPKLNLPNDQPLTFFSSAMGYSITNTVSVDSDKAKAINLFLGYFVMKPENNGKLAIASSQVPANINALDLDIIKNNTIIQGNMESLKNTVPVPNCTEMAIIWKVLDQGIEEVLYKDMNPVDVSASMQVSAEKLYKKLKK